MSRPSARFFLAGAGAGARERLGVAAALGLMLALSTTPAEAHERFVKHTLKIPLYAPFFQRGPWFLGVHPNILRIGINVAFVLCAFLIAWFMRQPMEQLVRQTVLRPVTGPAQRFLHNVSCFLTDRPVDSGWFHSLQQWSVILFLRSPGLVLMYSAANDSLVMPSYPLDPPSATFFKFAQVGLAILILTQTLLPLCGAILFGTWVYLHRWGWMVAADAIPVLTAAVVYMTSPWHSHKVAITELTSTQLRWARITLGVGFMILGWLKIYNHNLVAGVADNYPSVMNDPMVNLLAWGTDQGLRRETWIVAFGMAEVMSGFLLLAGIFTRIWCSIMIFIFAKLMLVDFGWDEMPHVYVIGALMALMLSNKLESEFDGLERHEDRFASQGLRWKQLCVIAAPAVLTCILIVFPLLYIFTFFDRTNL